MSRVRAELSRMDEEVKKARREREQLAKECLRQEMLAKMINTHKLIANPPRSLPNHLHYPRSLLAPAVQPKTEAVSEVLDLTISPCPSPDIKPPASDLNGVSLNGATLAGRGRPCAVVPETYNLEELISQERQRHSQVPLNLNMRVPPPSHAALNVPQQHVPTLKPNHSSFGVLTQQQGGSHAQSSAQYSALLSQLHRGHDKSLVLQLLNRMQRQTVTQSSHVTLHQNSQRMPHTSNSHAQLPSKRHLQPQPLESRVAQPDDFNFDDLDFGYPSPDSQLKYPFASQALPSSTPPPPPYSSSLFASAPTNSSLSDSSSSSSHFTPSSSSSEQTHLLPNGHSSMDPLDTLDHMIHGTPSDHRQSVIQFKSVDWDAT